MKILGIGNALVDALLLLEEDTLLSDLVLQKGSMTLIDYLKYQNISEMLEGKNVSYVPGGSVSNSIVGIAALGLEAGFLGSVANDDLGEVFRNVSLSMGVKPHLVVSEGNTGIATTFVSKDGERTFATYLGVASDIKLESLLVELDKYDLLYIEGYLMSDNLLLESIINSAKQKKLLVALDLASYNVVDENKDFLKKIIPGNIDILFANEQEAYSLTDKTPMEAVNMLAQWVDIAVVKMGEDGSVIQQKANQYQIAPRQLESECIDTTGAGDLYAAGFLYGFSEGCSLPVCGDMGSLLASEVIQHIGPKIPISRWETIKSEIVELKRK